MLLREYLDGFTKQQLLKQAKILELKKYSGLKKSELVQKILESYCTEKVIRERLSCLTKEQMILFREACKNPQDISIDNTIDAMQLCIYKMGCFEEPTDRFCVFEEIAEVFYKIDDEVFRGEQIKKGWLMKCKKFFVDYYGIAPIEILYELYRLKINDTVDEMIDMLWNMPIDMLESCMFPMDRMKLNVVSNDNPLYSMKGVFVHIPILENNELRSLLQEQMDKDFYIPSIQQIEEIYRIGYEVSSFAYEKLETFLRSQMDMPYEYALTWCLQIWTNAYEGRMPADVLRKMSASNVEFQSEKQMREFVSLLMNAHNSTRMKENRGHTPGELIVKDMKSEKKIYPNDPCPCGSGKKYKRCCGKK